VPLAAAPGFDDFRGDDVDEDLREGTAVRIAVEVVRGVIPAESWEKDERQEQVEAVVDDEQLPAGALDGRVVDEVLLGRVRADVAFQGEFAGDDFLDGDFLVPAVPAVFLLAAPRILPWRRTGRSVASRLSCVACDRL
jgi:hypothetical protein